MASISYSPKEIFEQEFKIGMRGYDRKEVDEFLDEVIKDYETFEAQIQALREENEALKAELQKAKAAQSAQVAKPSQPVNPVYATNPTATVTAPTYAGPSPVAQPSASQTSPQAATNFDILKRISRLELEVFGKQITE